MLKEIEMRSRIAAVCLCLGNAEEVFKLFESSTDDEYTELKRMFTAYEFQGMGGIPHKDESSEYSVARQLRFASQFMTPTEVPSYRKDTPAERARCLRASTSDGASIRLGDFFPSGFPASVKTGKTPVWARRHSR